jgi:hypothetical protein
MGIYISPPIDEIELHETITQEIPELLYQELNPRLLKEIQNRWGLDAATMALRIHLSYST